MSLADKLEKLMHKWHSEAPSNIALIKYMGKKNPKINLPANASLSYTLNNLRSEVSLELSNAKQDTWQPLNTSAMPKPITLSTNAQTRFLKHLQYIKAKFNCQQNFVVRSNNNFPQSCGIASSASSFAALTKCATQAICDLTNTQAPSIEDQANLSRQGSGSSCRSFFSPWALWEEDKVKPIDLPFKEFHHQVVIVNKQEKHISSSAAHKLIENSPHYKGRTNRATNNLQALLQALKSNNWHSAYEVCWEEFQDMHNLFNTCGESFTYITPVTLKLLQRLKDFWKATNDGPLITMDAGPNIHLLYRLDQTAMARAIQAEFFDGEFDVI